MTIAKEVLLPHISFPVESILNFVQEIFGLLQESQLQSASVAKALTPTRPAWSLVHCELAHFQECLEAAPDDFWLADPKCGNLVRLNLSMPTNEAVYVLIF